MEVLHRLAGPPIPNLGQGVPGAAAAADPSAQPPTGGVPTQQAPLGTGSLTPGAASTPLSPGNVTALILDRLSFSPSYHQTGWLNE